MPEGARRDLPADAGERVHLPAPRGPDRPLGGVRPAVGAEPAVSARDHPQALRHLHRPGDPVCRDGQLGRHPQLPRAGPRPLLPGVPRPVGHADRHRGHRRRRRPAPRRHPPVRGGARQGHQEPAEVVPRRPHPPARSARPVDPRHLQPRAPGAAGGHRQAVEAARALPGRGEALPRSQARAVRARPATPAEQAALHHPVVRRPGLPGLLRRHLVRHRDRNRERLGGPLHRDDQHPTDRPRHLLVRHHGARQHPQRLGLPAPRGACVRQRLPERQHPADHHQAQARRKPRHRSLPAAAPRSGHLHDPQRPTDRPLRQPLRRLRHGRFRPHLRCTSRGSRGIREASRRPGLAAPHVSVIRRGRGAYGRGTRHAHNACTLPAPATGRGDDRAGHLAIELGFGRLAEIQTEIVDLCHGAQVPVVWATQVLEDLAEDGWPSRAETTDASMAQLADRVMLDEGPYQVHAVRLLGGVLRRMDRHRSFGGPRLSVLHAWDGQQELV
ncbi:MAG: hypothetical protein H6837_03085 [Planctomycetes bacterium]|nr:hypothetical protein [Planctomycetota bacterium]